MEMDNRASAPANGDGIHSKMKMKMKGGMRERVGESEDGDEGGNNVEKRARVNVDDEMSEWVAASSPLALIRSFQP